MKKIILLFALISSTVSLYAQIPPYIPANGLIAWYPFSGNANDGSGNGNNGTVNGAALTTDRFSAANSAYYFNGNADIRVPYSSFFDFGTTISFTISTWVKIDAFSDYFRGHLAYACQDFGGSGGFQLMVSESASHPLYNEYGIGQTTNSNLADYGWHNLTFVFDRTVHYVFIFQDGALTDSAFFGSSYTFTPTCYPPIRIGGERNSNPIHYFKGKIDDLCFWNRILSDAEIMQLYTGCGNLITASPSSQSINKGGLVEFTVTSTGNTFQWQRNTGAGFVNISNGTQFSGADDDTLVITGADSAMDGNYFRCIVSLAGCCDTSNAAMLYVSDNNLVFSQVILVTSQQTVPPHKVWKIESVTGARVTQYNYRSRNDADFNPSGNLILINGSPVSAINVLSTGAQHGSGDAGGSAGFAYAASPTNFPFWIPPGTTLAASTNVSFISVIEFDVVP